MLVCSCLIDSIFVEFIHLFVTTIAKCRVFQLILQFALFCPSGFKWHYTQLSLDLISSIQLHIHVQIVLTVLFEQGDDKDD